MLLNDHHGIIQCEFYFSWKISMVFPSVLFKFVLLISTVIDVENIFKEDNSNSKSCIINITIISK